MKRYKLLKDLPTFDKGDIFRIDEDSGCLVREKDGVVAYAPYTLERFNILDSDWFEEITEGERWRAYKGDLYWYVSSYGEARDATCSGMELYCSTDDCRYSIGNYFKTEEEAKKAVEWLKAFTVLRDDTKGFKPDWWNCDKEQWVVEYRPHDDVQLVADYYRYVQNGVIYFATKDDALESIKKHEREWKIYYGVEE